MALVLSMIGIIVIVAIVAIGTYAVARNAMLRQTTERYKYVKTRDVDGNVITKVVDLNDEGDDE